MAEADKKRERRLVELQQEQERARYKTQDSLQKLRRKMYPTPSARGQCSRDVNGLCSYKVELHLDIDWETGLQNPPQWVTLRCRQHCSLICIDFETSTLIGCFRDDSPPPPLDLENVVPTRTRCGGWRIDDPRKGGWVQITKM